ncbi:hypothetical protein [Pontibacter pudoricolor]|uniref:hypothetical protein n=1 Tax=Pontibacter pudoricolor TaxID=2694930 RepID=UPI001391408D|nr:hypothetical protein [Pontibacter pudoricolor]
MEELSKLIDIIEYKGKFVETAILDYSDNSNLETRLLHLVKYSKPENETWLVKELYGSENKTSAYKMLKSRLKKKLYNQLLFLDIDKLNLSNEVKIYELKCRKILFLAHTLYSFEEVKLAKKQIQNVLSVAEEMQLIEPQVEAYELLRILISDSEYNRKSYDECVQKLKELYKLREIINKADTFYFDIKFDMKLGVESSKKFLTKLSIYVDELYEDWLRSNLGPVFKRYYQLKLVFFEVKGDIAAHIDHINKAFEFYEQGKISDSYFSVSFNKYLLVYSCLLIRDYPKGLAEAEELKYRLEEGSRNWFAHMENYFLLAVHAKDYKKAEDILIEVFGQKFFKYITEIAQERWTVFYLVYQNAFNYSLPLKLKTKLHIVTQDKKGFNLWRLILDYMIALDKLEPDLLSREAERIKKYSSKYLTAAEDARTKYFLKMLLISAREFTNLENSRKKGQPLFEKLKKAPIPGLAYAELEIVPYEQLWEIILQKIERNK